MVKEILDPISFDPIRRFLFWGLIATTSFVIACLHNLLWKNASSKSSLQNAGDLFYSAWEGLRGDNILSKTLFLILLLTLAEILLRTAQISSENLWRDLRCPSASLKVFVLQIQYKGACRHLDPCCAADAAQGHTNPPCDIQQQQKKKIMRWNCFCIQPTNNFLSWGTEEKVFFPLFFFFWGLCEFLL